MTLSVRPSPGDDKRVLFEVRDTGIGMSDDQIANLFKRFQQADQTTTRKYGGTGLGLALTQALVIMMGGEIRVESRPGEARPSPSSCRPTAARGRRRPSRPSPAWPSVARGLRCSSWMTTPARGNCSSAS